MSKKNIILIILVVAAIGVGVWYALTTNNLSLPSEGEAVATVNGEKITNSEFQAQLEQAQQLASQQGLNIQEQELKNRVLDQMIGNVLIKQKAKEEGIEVKQSEVDAEIEKVIQQLGGEESFNKQLENADITREELEGMTKEQLIAQKYIENQIPEGELEVSDQEVKNYFDQVMAQQGGENATNTPSLEDMDEAQIEQIRSQLRQQKQTSKSSEVIEELREEADIEKNL